MDYHIRNCKINYRSLKVSTVLQTILLLLQNQIKSLKTLVPFWWIIHSPHVFHKHRWFSDICSENLWTTSMYELIRHKFDGSIIFIDFHTACSSTSKENRSWGELNKDGKTKINNWFEYLPKQVTVISETDNVLKRML